MPARTTLRPIAAACLACPAIAGGDPPPALGDPPLVLGDAEVAQALIGGATDMLVVGDSQNTYGHFRGQLGIMRTWEPDRWAGRIFSGYVGSVESGVRVKPSGADLISMNKKPDEPTSDPAGLVGYFPRQYQDITFTGDIGNFARIDSFSLSHLEDDYAGGDPYLGQAMAMKAILRDDAGPEMMPAFRIRQLVDNAPQGPWVEHVLSDAGLVATETLTIPAGAYTEWSMNALELIVAPIPDADETGQHLQLCGATMWTIDDEGKRTGGLVVGASAVSGYAASDWLDATDPGPWTDWLAASTTGPDQTVLMIMLGHNTESGSFAESLTDLIDMAVQATEDALGQPPMLLIVAPWYGGEMHAAKRDAMVQIAQERPEPTLFVSLFDIYGDGVNPFEGGDNNIHPENEEEAEDWTSRVWEQVVIAAGCPADLNGDGVLNILDFVTFQILFNDGDPQADCNDDAEFSVLDFVCYQSQFTAGCP